MARNGELTSPVALPRASWGDTLKRTVAEFKEDKLNHWGAALTYYAVLSLFPALLVLVSLVGLFGDPERVTKVLTDTVSQLGPSTAAETFQGPIESLTGSRGTRRDHVRRRRRVRAVGRVRLRQRVRRRVQLDLRGRGGTPVLEAQAAAAPGHVRR